LFNSATGYWFLPMRAQRRPLDWPNVPLQNGVKTGREILRLKADCGRAHQDKGWGSLCSHPPAAVSVVTFLLASGYTRKLAETFPIGQKLRPDCGR
jgi:hypothetical protein